MNKIRCTAVALILAAGSYLFAVVPQKWEMRRFSSFLEGKLTGLSLSDEGIMRLSQKEDILEGPEEDFYLSVLVNEDKSLFLGTGHSGKIYRLDENGKKELYFQASEMDVYCMLSDGKGNIYAGTSPNGKIYKIDRNGKGEEFFNPGEKYIWDLMFAPSGNLLAAVGENGGIYEVTRAGEGIRVLDTQENHILCMMRDGQDILAGSGGKGHLYRISKDGRTEIIYASPYEEIRSMALDNTGRIYIAASGEVIRSQAEAVQSLKSDTSGDVSITVSASAPDAVSDAAGEKSGQPGALYRIDRRGIAEKLWSSPSDMIYSLAWDKNSSRILFGTGNKGRLFAIEKNDGVALILQRDSEQVYLLAPTDSLIYMLSNNPAGIARLYPEQRDNGEYISRVLDSGTLSAWGRMEWRTRIPRDSFLQFQTRSGNTPEPNRTWSEWSPPYSVGDGEQILSPKARYIQYKINFKSQSGRLSPEVESIALTYLQSNLAPEIQSLELMPPNEVFIKPSPQDDVIWGMNSDISSEKSVSQNLAMAKKTDKKGFRTAVWNASDENADSLVFSVYIRAEAEQKWRLLADDIIDPIFAFDTMEFPDGTYFLKVEASDRISNPIEAGLNTERISRPLIIDNTQPEITGFRAVRKGTELQISFTAGDSRSSIQEVLVLVRPGNTHIVFPEDGICDSRSESFKFSLPLQSDSDDMIIIKVKDSQGNIGVLRQSF